MSYCTSCAELEKRSQLLERRRGEMRALLRRLSKQARGLASTEGHTRLLRVVEQVDDYLSRTTEPQDLLR